MFFHVNIVLGQAIPLIQSIAGNLDETLGPIFAMLLGIISIRFLLYARIVEFLIFLLMAGIVAMMIYNPGLISYVAQNIWCGASSGGNLYPNVCH